MGSPEPEPTEVGGYIVERRLGRDGQATVYLARAADGAPVAVKVLRAAWLAQDGARERLEQEITALRDVAPFATSRLLAAEPDADPPYLVSEYVPGPSLQQRVERAGPLTGSALQQVAVGTVTALLAIHHTGVVHLDVKPANIIVGPQGVRIIDFGVPGDEGAVDDGDAGVLGTVGYLAPERLDGHGASSSADVYAWAATMVFAGTGRIPSGAEIDDPGSPLWAGLDAEYASLLRDCLDADPKARPAADEVLLRLVEAFGPKDPTTPLDPPPPPAVPPGSAIPATEPDGRALLGAVQGRKWASRWAGWRPYSRSGSSS